MYAEIIKHIDKSLTRKSKMEELSE